MGEGETFMDGMKPIALKPTFDAIPAEIKHIAAWVVWRYEFVGDKWTKVPYRADGAGRASSTDPATWSTFQGAVDRYQRGGVDGIGFVLDPQNEIAGVDLDHCVTESTAVWAAKIMFQLDSYAELSPSGTGLRILLKGTIPPGRRKTDRIEMYDRARYLTITGHHRSGTPQTIEPRQEQIAALHAHVFAPEPPPKRLSIYSAMRPQLADRELLERAFRAANGDKVKRLFDGDLSLHNDDWSRADLALCAELGYYTTDAAQVDRLFRASKLFREKWDEKHFGDGRTYGEGTILKALEGR
jgi:primase-polymerase (primpol)-like protein